MLSALSPLSKNVDASPSPSPTSFTSAASRPAHTFFNLFAVPYSTVGQLLSEPSSPQKSYPEETSSMTNSTPHPYPYGFNQLDSQAMLSFVLARLAEQTYDFFYALLTSTFKSSSKNLFAEDDYLTKEIITKNLSSIAKRICNLEKNYDELRKTLDEEGEDMEWAYDALQEHQMQLDDLLNSSRITEKDFIELEENLNYLQQDIERDYSEAVSRLIARNNLVQLLKMEN